MNAGSQGFRGKAEKAVEWPMPRPSLDGAEPLLPLALAEHVQLVMASPVVAGFCEKRAAQMLPPFNHTPEADLDLPVDVLVRRARDSLTAFLEIVGRGRMDLPPGRRDQLLRYLDTGGGLLIAARERAAASPEQPAEDDQP